MEGVCIVDFAANRFLSQRECWGDQCLPTSLGGYTTLRNKQMINSDKDKEQQQQEQSYTKKEVVTNCCVLCMTTSRPNNLNLDDNTGVYFNMQGHE